jgi:hypothetical protein
MMKSPAAIPCPIHRWPDAPARRRAQRGMSIVEFVVVSPFAFLVVLGLIQLGLMFTAKQIVNEAAFVAARAGAVQHAQVGPMRQALIKALIPFYQDTTITNDPQRLLYAWLGAQGDLAVPGRLEITVLNPNADVFNDFGLTDSNNQTYIPNDNLNYRDHSVRGQASGLSIQDANVLKIRVTYAYQLKVPLMQSVVKSVMCGFDSGVNAFGRGKGLLTGVASAQDCIEYYLQGRVPIVSYATVQMQSPAWPS